MDARHTLADEGCEPERTTRHTPAAAPPPTRATRATFGPLLPKWVLSKLLLAMYAKRHFTGATSTVYGHFDGFGREVEDDLENKMTIDLDPRYRWVGVRLHELPKTGLLPPGFLAYARTRAATVCVSRRDYEFHQLSRAVHFGGNTRRWFALRTGVARAFATLASAANVHCKGESAATSSVCSTQALLERTAGMADEGTLRCSWGEDGACNLRGVALCDWWEGKSNRERRAFLRANNRPVVTGPGGIVYYFGPAAGAALVAGAGQLPAVAGAAGAAGAGGAAGSGSDDDE